MIVVDASAVVELTVHLPRYQAVDRRLRRAGGMHAPHLVDIEVASALRRLVQRRMVSEERASQAFEGFVDLRLVRYPHVQLLQRIWELRHALSPYDAAYVALAEALEAPLLTADARLARSTGHRARIELVPA